jgi:FemAB-related protein (PEP-CTERM system-associated)
MNVEICADPLRWDAYVASAPEASNYHRWGWRDAIEETFGHNAYYFSAVDNGSITGVLPLVHIKSRIFGHFLVSVPFFSYGGVLATTPDVAASLTAAAEQLAREVGARHIELRQGREFSTAWTSLTPKVTMEVELPSTVQELSERLSPKMRKRIRFARKNGLEPQWGGSEALAYFYPVFATNMRNLGTPVYPRSWFENICRQFPDQIRILTLLEQGKPVASAFVSIFRDTVELPWAATLPDSRDKFSPLLLYWTLLEWALENGYRRVDLGRCTPGSGNHGFKKRWVCKEKPLHWYYWLAPGAAVPELRPDNPRYRMATQVWKHLPLTVANLLGPRIVRSIP